MKLNTNLLVAGLIGWFLLVLTNTAMAKQPINTLHFNGDKITARVYNAPLKEILSHLEVKKGIQLKGQKTVLNELVTVAFSNISVEDAIKRLLLRINYSILYDAM